MVSAGLCKFDGYILNLSQANARVPLTKNSIAIVHFLLNLRGIV